ncbi:MAG: ATP-binding cassette domain-containing protein [Spirochaetales bacterium]|nr:ATP-binding cassette domain-containing protein [Spirochaetales bacterium]
MSAPNTLLELDSVSYFYPGRELAAVRDVSFTVRKGEYLAVLGANGSGKSTLARLLVNLLQPAAGHIRRPSPSQIPSALVFQSPGDQIVAETVELDVAFGAENIGVGKDCIHERVYRALASLSLQDSKDASTFDLSTGKKQLCALAGTFVLEPDILVLDEPTSQLSPIARGELLLALEHVHAAGGTIIHITHDNDEASRAGRILIMRDASLVFDGPVTKWAALSPKKLDEWSLFEHLDEERPYNGTGPLGQRTRELVLACSNLSLGPLESFSADFCAGTVTAILGESGSGKSLLFEILADLQRPLSGSVYRSPGQTLALAIQESEASLFEEFVADDIAFAPRNAGLSGQALVARVRSTMDMVGLPFDRFADRLTFSLSGGEKRKAALAGILAMDSSIILLDEPTSGLDIPSRGALLALISTLAEQGKTVIFTTNRSEECRVADQVITLAPGAQSTLGKEPECSVKELNGVQKTLARLRSTARGGYGKIQSPIHCLSPLAKYLLVILSVGAALIPTSPLSLAALLFPAAILLALSRLPLARVLRRILGFLPWLAVIGLIQYYFSRDVAYTASFFIRFLLIYLPLSVFSWTTSHTEIMYGMEDVLSPLRVFGFPARDVSLVAGIVFRFIPLLYQEAARIICARSIRLGNARAKGGLFSRISLFASLIVPLIMRTLVRADRLAEAITARYYGAAVATRYLQVSSRRPLILVGMAFVYVLVTTFTMIAWG